MSDTAYTPAPTLQRIRELQAQDVSLRDISDLFAAEGVPLPGRCRKWSHTAVRRCLHHPTSAPSAPPAADLAQAPEPQFAAVPTKMDQPPARLEQPIESGWRFWPRTRWGGGLLGGVWGAEVTSGVVLLAVWWTL